jgi:hypothetical protein
MNRILRTAAVICALGSTTLAASPALAASPTTPPTTTRAADRTPEVAKKAVIARIDKRLAALKKFTETLSKADRVQSSHRSTLTTLITDQTAGLTTLRAKVEKETTREAVKADATSMVTDYRVFLLTGPKVRLTAAVDTELAAVDKLRDAKGADTAKLDAVEKSLTGKVDTLLALKPGPDGAQLRTGVKEIRQSAKDARTTLKSLRKAK